MAPPVFVGRNKESDNMPGVVEHSGDGSERNHAPSSIKTSILTRLRPYAEPREPRVGEGIQVSDKT